MLFFQAETENNFLKDALRIKVIMLEGEVLSLEWCFGSDLFPQNWRTIGSKLNLGWKGLHWRPSSPRPSEPPNEAGRLRHHCVAEQRSLGNKSWLIGIQRDFCSNIRGVRGLAQLRITSRLLCAPVTLQKDGGAGPSTIPHHHGNAAAFTIPCWDSMLCAHHRGCGLLASSG